MVIIDWARPGGKRPRAIVLLGVAVGFAGLIVLVGFDAASGRAEVDATAAIVLMAASAAWACGSVFNRVADRPESAALSTGIQMLGGSVGLLVVGVSRGELSALHIAQISAPSWAGWIYLVTFGSLIGFTAYIFLLKAVSPAKASTYAYVNPLVAVFLGWAIAGESVTGRTLGAAAVILAGVAMISAAA
jgi:drug/metabolite transporter (DMT)-like permease